ncbi:MAG: glycosyltransferase family 2 protein [Chromatiales bacterium]|nr:glycosyltransferase family 2 protein [Chromatiales bacterium]
MLTLDIVVPCYNEEEVLGETVRRLTAVCRDLVDKGKIASESRIYLVDDGSRDRTWELIEGFCQSDLPVRGIKLARNYGHQRAVFAGLMTAQGDAVISIDADLQDDLDAIEKMVDAHVEGYDVVYGVRDDRSSDTFFKRFSAESYYRLLNAMGVETVFNHADYRLMSRAALSNLGQFQETNLFLRGMVPLVGLPSTTVSYARSERFAGESKYPLGKMIALALEGVSSFSAVPLRLIFLVGIALFVLSTGLGIWGLYVAFSGASVPGWASTVVPIYFLGSILLLSIGVIGEYLGKIYIEVKRRPRYLVEKVL